MTTTPTPDLPVESCPNYFVPAYGFGTNEAAARAYLEGLSDRGFGRSPELIRSDSGERFYVSRPWIDRFELRNPVSRRFGRYDFSDTVSRGSIGSGESGEAWTSLCSQSRPRPAHAHNVILLTTGRRRFHQMAPHKLRGINEKINSGPRDIYGHWTRLDGSDFAQSARTTPWGQMLFAVQSGRGVIYARPWSYDSFHGMNPPMDKVILVWFQIRDRDPEKDDVVQVEVCTTHLYGQGDTLRPSERDNIDPRWLPLIDAAVKGYRDHCRDIPPEIQAMIAECERERRARESTRRIGQYR